MSHPLHPISLKAGGFAVLVEPWHGALVRSIVWTAPDGRSLPLLHAPADGAIDLPRATVRFGAWPMVPFANRAFDGHLAAGEERFALPLNAGDGRSTIHGFGWQDRWSVLDQASDGLVILHERREGADPYRYRAILTIRIDPDGVLMELAVANRATRPLPFGLGLHPWFPRDADTAIACEARASLMLGEGFRPLHEAPLPDHVDLSGSAPLAADREIALSLLDWRGEARVLLPTRRYAIGITASDNLRHPVLWSPPGADFVCFEPQSHAIGAPSEPHVQAITPLAWLEAGESVAGWMRLRPLDLG